MSIIHVAIEDAFSHDDEPEGMFACERCGQPTWYRLCDECDARSLSCGHGADYRDERGVCQARGCLG